jgi:hypothetical protein
MCFPPDISQVVHPGVRGASSARAGCPSHSRLCRSVVPRLSSGDESGLAAAARRTYGRLTLPNDSTLAISDLRTQVAKPSTQGANTICPP